MTFELAREIGIEKFQRLSMNPNITWETIENNPDYPWDYSQLSQNHHIGYDNFPYVLK